MCNCNKCGVTPPIMGRRWNFTSDFVALPQQGYPVRDMCNAVAVRNVGNTNVIWNQETLEPGASKSITMHAGDDYAGRIDIGFTIPAGLIDPPVNGCYVTQVFYTQSL